MDFRDPTEVSRLKAEEQKKTNGAINVTIMFIFNQYYEGIKLGALVKSGNTIHAQRFRTIIKQKRLGKTS